MLALAVPAAAGLIASAYAEQRSAPPGAYATRVATDERACANQCAADNLCMSWRYESSPRGSCGLYAVAYGGASGLSPRAPQFARLDDASGASAPASTAAPAHVAAPKPDKIDTHALLGGADEPAAPTAPSVDLRSRLDAPAEDQRSAR